MEILTAKKEPNLSWEINSEALAEIGEERKQLNTLLANFLSNLEDGMLNYYGANKLYSKIGSLEEKIKKINQEKEKFSNFEKIYLEDIKLTVNSARTLYKFFRGKEKQEIRIYQLLNAIYDQYVYEYLKGVYRDVLKDKNFYNTNIFLRELNAKRIPSDLIMGRIKNHLVEIASLIEEFGNDLGALKGIEVIPCPDTDDISLLKRKSPFNKIYLLASKPYAPETFWDCATFIMQLDPNKIYFYEDRNKNVIAFDLIWQLFAAHELGHALLQFNSEKMPEDLRYSISDDHLLRDCVHEGVGIQTELSYIHWCRRKKKLSKKKFSLMKNLFNYFINSLSGDVVYNLYRHESKDFSKEFHEIKNVVFFFKEEPFIETLEKINTLVGYKFTRDIFEIAKKKYGKDFVKKNEGIILGGLSIGLFRPKTKVRFIFEEYLPRMSEFLN